MKGQLMLGFMFLMLAVWILGLFVFCEFKDLHKKVDNIIKRLDEQR